jgi:hypothetical protein
MQYLQEFFRVNLALAVKLFLRNLTRLELISIQFKRHSLIPKFSRQRLCAQYRGLRAHLAENLIFLLYYDNLHSLLVYVIIQLYLFSLYIFFRKISVYFSHLVCLCVIL